MGIRINQNELRKMEKELKRQIGDLEYKIGRNASETERNIAAALKKKNIDVDRRKITIRGEVTGEGLYEAIVKVHPNISTTIKVHVQKES